MRAPSQPSQMTVAVTKAVRAMLAAEPSPENLHKSFRYLAKWRAEVIARTFEARGQTVVMGGPFKGMAYGVRASEGSRTARLLGAYEASLHPVIESIIAKAPELVVDIGSAEGYYAVGLARRLPGARVLARDQSPQAQALCAALVGANGVAGQVEIGGLFGHEDFDLCTRARSVVICDIEGAELALLDPELAPGLAHADILVECHPGFAADVVAVLTACFSPTHKITKIGRKLEDTSLPEWMENLSDLDRLIALWEWRQGPTPWLWMERK